VKTSERIEVFATEMRKFCLAAATYNKAEAPEVWKHRAEDPTYCALMSLYMVASELLDDADQRTGAQRGSGRALWRQAAADASVDSDEAGTYARGEADRAAAIERALTALVPLK
jgi:hypothetical protein